MDTIFLPYPKSFAKYCTYSPDETVPVWFSGCAIQNTNLFFSDLFGNSLKFKNLDKASANAINEFAINIIDTDHLFSDLKAPAMDISLVSLIDFKPIVDCLKSNNLVLLSDLNKFGFENILRIKKLGIKKAIYVFIAIAEFNESLLNDATLAIHEDVISDEDMLSIVNKYSDEIPLSRIYLFDPRFRFNYKNFIPMNDRKEFDFPTWNDFYMSGEFSSNAEKIAAIEQFSDEYKLLNNLSLEEQMSHFFTEYIKSSAKKVFIKRNLKSFNNIRDRLGIKESVDKKITLQETANLFDKPVTRERVRQIAKEHLQALDAIPGNEEIFIPKLSEVLKILQENLNKSLSDISQLLSKKGYGEWNIHRLLDCCDLFRLPNHLTINGEFLNDKSMVKVNNYILKIAKKITNYNGAVNADHLHNAISSNFSIDKEHILSVLKGSFDEFDDDWFFHTTSHNQIISIAQKMANFSKDYTIQSLRDGHMKHKRFRQSDFFADKGRTGFYGFLTPPSMVIGKVVNSSNDFIVKDGNIHCINLNNSFIDDTSSGDYQFLKYFQARNFDCATFDELKTFFIVQNNMAESSLYTFLTYKPYFMRLAGQVYGIVGQETDSLSVDNARKRIKKSVPPKIEWSKNGLEIKLKLKNVSSFTISLQEYDEYITKDEFKVFHNGKEDCLLKKSKSFFWYGIGGYLHYKLFCELGDFIKIQLDLTSYEARVELITEDEFEN